MNEMWCIKLTCYYVTSQIKCIAMVIWLAKRNDTNVMASFMNENK